MKVIALGNLSGVVGERAKGEEFIVDARLGASLVARSLVREVAEAAHVTEKAAKAKE